MVARSKLREGERDSVEKVEGMACTVSLFEVPAKGGMSLVLTEKKNIGSTGELKVPVVEKSADSLRVATMPRRLPYLVR
jgi:hypothetical protein